MPGPGIHSIIGRDLRYNPTAVASRIAEMIATEERAFIHTEEREQ
jgi:hypothetical protein